MLLHSGGNVLILLSEESGDQLVASNYVSKQFFACGIIEEDFVFGIEIMGFDWDRCWCFYSCDSLCIICMGDVSEKV